MKVIEKDFIVGGHPLGTFPAFDHIDGEFLAHIPGERVIPAPFLREKGAHFNLIKRYEPEEKKGFLQGGYEVREQISGAVYSYDLDQVIRYPLTPKQKHIVKELIDGDSEVGRSSGATKPERVSGGKRGRQPLSAEEKARRAAEASAKPIRGRGRPKDPNKPVTAPYVPSGRKRGRPKQQ